MVRGSRKQSILIRVSESDEPLRMRKRNRGLSTSQVLSKANLAETVFHKLLRIKDSDHHLRHRTRVRRSAPQRSCKRRIRFMEAPPSNADISMMTVPRYTLRPRNLMDGGVMRFLHS